MDQHYITIEAASPWTVASAEQLIALAAEEAKKQGVSRILLDLRAWERPDTEMTRFWSGALLAKGLRPPYRVAAFALPQAITLFGEHAAINRGALFRIFGDEETARRWLLQ